MGLCIANIHIGITCCHKWI